MSRTIHALLLCAVSSVLVAGSPCFGHLTSATTTTDDPLKEFLQAYVGIPDRETYYRSAEIDLNSDGSKEVIVYLVGGGRCGSGGCSGLILRPEAGSYRIVSKLSLVRLPICVTARTSHGWSNLTVMVRGGGILQAYEAELRFNGVRYSKNPTLPPARRLTGNAKARVLISETDVAKPLFP
jgi:hypothetical protein